jgi:CheY-like chemotaxis protein
VYGTLQLRVAEELARRAGVAIENARLLHALKEADRHKDEFLAVLAHELRNPLAPVRNAVEILRATQASSPQLQWTHDVIERQVRQMSRLVDDLLDVSRIARGKITIKREPVDLVEAIRLALETSRPVIERGGHEFTLRIKPGILPVEGDLARLAQVISNLLNNAARYTPSGGHIWLSAQRHDGKAELVVGDNGIGIEASMRGRIFEMFTQGKRCDGERSQGGLGIGLTLVKRLVEMHGGTVEALSDGAGRGSQFVVRLPLAAEGLQAAVGGEHSPAAVGSHSRRRILVVDDNRDAADSLAMLLQARGHEVRVAYDGLEAVGSAVAFDPDVVLMDIGLPKLYGYDAARRIRKARGNSVQLIAITGWGQEEDRRRAKEAGFDFHLTKPVDPEAIARLIDDGASRAPE